MRTLFVLVLKAGKGLFGIKRRVSGRVARTWLSVSGITYGSGLIIWSLPFCRKAASGTIQIGSNVTVRNRLSENPAGITHPCVLYAGPGARLLIGNHVGLSGVILYCTREIIVEDWVTIGAGARIYDTDFHPLNYLDRRAHKAESIGAKSVRICEDAFVGAAAMILKGVTVGARSIVAAGAVVTTDVPPDTLVAGVPARVIRKLVR